MASWCETVSPVRTNPTPIIGTAEVATLLGWSLARVKEEAKAGRLPIHAKMPGLTGAYLFDRDAIIAHMSDGAA